MRRRTVDGGPPARAPRRCGAAGRAVLGSVVVVAIVATGAPARAATTVAAPAFAAPAFAAPAFAAPAGPVVARQVDAPGVVYSPPADAPVVDRFRPPSTPYGAGNRGWEYATAPGTVVRAAADGVVTFAGPVGGTVAVTVRHADGLRTSASRLEAALVREGASVARGDPVGRSGAGFHFGVRRGDTYLDPATLFGEPAEVGPPRPRPRLVPLGR